jgi:hypothetical protein
VVYRYDHAVARESATLIGVVIVTPACLGGRGMMFFIDMCTKEKTDPYHPLYMIVHRMVMHVQTGHPGVKQEALHYIQALYFQKF